MSTLTQLIDNLPPIELLESHSKQEGKLILQILNNAKNQIIPYDGEFVTSWLLSDFGDEIWYTSNRGREEWIDGEWKNTIVINWNLVLSNGAHLTDRSYAKLLEANKKIAFLLREGFSKSVHYSPKFWLKIVHAQLRLSRWLVVHEDRYKPEEYAFLLLDQPALNMLFQQLAMGGWAEVFQLPQRLLRLWYHGAHNKPCPQALLDNPYSLEPEVCASLCQWLSKENYYAEVNTGPNRGLLYLNREKIASAINEPREIVVAYRGKMVAFFRQFEPDFSNSDLLLSVHQATEIPNHKTKKRRQIITEGVADRSLDINGVYIAAFLSGQRHLPELLPDPAALSIKTAKSKATRLTRPSSHTPFIPVNIGLAYLNQAMRWVHVYGDAIVDCYVAVMSAINFDLLKKSNRLQQLTLLTQAFLSAGPSKFTIVENGIKKHSPKR